MKVIRKRPGEEPELIEVENTLKALQEEVGGYIETVSIATDLVVICDEEGRLKGKAHNCGFVGTILVVGVDGDEFCDVPEVALTLFGAYKKAPTEAGTSCVGANLKNQLNDIPLGEKGQANV